MSWLSHVLNYTRKDIRTHTHNKYTYTYIHIHTLRTHTRAYANANANINVNTNSKANSKANAHNTQDTTHKTQTPKTQHPKHNTQHQQKKLTVWLVSVIIQKKLRAKKKERSNIHVRGMLLVDQLSIFISFHVLSYFTTVH